MPTYQNPEFLKESQSYFYVIYIGQEDMNCVGQHYQVRQWYSEQILIEENKVTPLELVERITWKIREPNALTRQIRGLQLSSITGPANAQHNKK